MYDFYPEWGYARHRSEDDPRDEEQERPDDN